MSPVLAQAAFDGPTIDWWALVPIIVLAGGGLALMVVAALLPDGWRRGWYAAITCAIAAGALVVSFVQWENVQDDGPVDIAGGAMSLDGFSVFLTITICAAVILTALLADDYLRREGMDGPEFYALLLMSAVGAVIMSSASDLIVLFLGLETLSIALYILAASHLRRVESQESGLKYFVLGSFSSAFLLYGIALVYGATGSTNLGRIAAFLDDNVLLDDGLLLAGFALLLVGLGFKVAAAPFHVWTADVYEGAPSPVTGFMASAVKAAAFAALLRVFVVGFAGYEVDWRPAVWVIAVLTLAVGAILAVVQTNVKRMLAYSSINHAGFILVGVQASSPRGTSAALFYVMSYALIVVGTFGVVTLVGRAGDAAHSLDAYRGLSRRRPVLALAFTLLLLAQAGVPLTAGFVAKFDVILAAADAESYALAIIAMASAVIAAFLYLRVIVSMYLAEPDPADEASPVAVPLSAGLAIGASLAFTLVVGFVPGFLVEFARDAVPVLASSR